MPSDTVRSYESAAEKAALLAVEVRKLRAWAAAEDNLLRELSREGVRELRGTYARTGEEERGRIFPPQLIHDLRDVGALLEQAPDTSLRRTLKGMFGYEAFRPGQEAIIRSVLARLDCLAVMPTGAGKSLTFQIPARTMGGTTLVISPLIALMKDQVDALERHGMHATYLNSSLGETERRQRLSALCRGKFEVVYAAPEGLEFYLASLLENVDLRLLAVDEAHCIGEWGYDFRPAYRNLARLKQRFGGIPLLALTATATERVQRDIISQLGMEHPVRFQGSSFRPNLRITVVKKTGNPPVGKSIVRLVKARKKENGIIYCIRRQDADDLAYTLRENGISAESYHAGLENDLRHQRQEDFQKGRTKVIVATVAFGMGIDISNIRYVIHRDMPRSLESYAQEMGRAGRDGHLSDCILFYAWPDVLAHDYFASEQKDSALSQQRHDQARRMYRFAETEMCRHKGIAAYFGEAMAACGNACDVCTGRDILAEATPAGRSKKR
jgi:ATP-dependent DNA helicase RecQ